MTSIDLFAGAGGAALGLHRADYRCLAAIERDPDAAAVLRAALPDVPVVEADVRTVEWAPYAGRADLLWASPPCQAWSTAGKRLGAADERNGWPWTFDAIDAIQPKWAICENVPGLLSHKKISACIRHGGEIRDGDWYVSLTLFDRSLLLLPDALLPPDDYRRSRIDLTLRQIIAVSTCPGCYWSLLLLPALRARFAHVEARILDAADYGVPQRRRRVFVVAGPAPFAWPDPTHADPALLRQVSLLCMALRPWRTVRDALGLGGAIIRESGQGAARDARSCDEPAYGMRVQHHGGGCGVAIAVDVPAPTLRAQSSVDASGHQGGHAAPLILSGQTSEMACGRVPVASSVDAPSMTVRSQGGTGLRLAYRRGRDGGMKEESHSLDEPSCALRGAPGGSTQPYLMVGQEHDRAVPCMYDGHTGSDPDRPAKTIKAGVHGIPGGEAGNNSMYVQSGVGRTDTGARGTPRSVDDPSPSLAGGGSGVNLYLHAGGSRPELLDQPAPTVTAAEEKDTRASPSSAGRMNGGPDRASDAAYLGMGVRRLSVEECACLQSFPADWPWHAARTKTARYRCVGNAVPAPMVEALGRALLATLTTPSSSTP